jgi:Kef-type K+ transport system membrane component KefB
LGEGCGAIAAPQMTALVALHAASFWLTATAVVLLALTSAVDLVTRRLHRVVLDRLVLAVLAVSAVGAITGAAMLVMGGRPSEPLHLLYGVAAPAVVAVARVLGRRTELRQRAGWLLVGTIVTGGVLLRLWATGG